MYFSDMKKVTIFIIFLASSFLTFSQQVDNSVKRYYFRDSIVSMEKWYGDDEKLDSLKTYYKSGELDEDFHYKRGYFNGFSYKFNKKGEKLTTWRFEKGKLIERTDHKIEFNSKTEEKVKNSYAKLKVLNEQLKVKPNNFKLTFQRASILKYLGNNTLALNDFKRIEKSAIKLSKSKNLPEKMMGSIYDHLATIYDGYEMEINCIHYKLKALKASPKESRLYHNLGSYLIEIKSYRLGIEYLNKAIEMVPNHSFANWVLAMAYTELEDYEKAMICVNTAFKNEDNLYKKGQGTAERDLRTIRGFLYHKLGDSQKGIADLEEALNINIDNSFALRNLGVIYYDLNNYSKSCELLQKAKKLGYEKTHDKYDLQEYLDNACQKASALEEELVAKSEPIKTARIIDQPYVYPNPGSDIVRIKNLSFDNFTYEIYDYTSKLILRNSSINGSVVISALPQGVYVLNIISDNGLKESFRIIKE